MTLFSFHPKNSFLHTLDVRCKFFLVCIFSIAVVNAEIIVNFIYLTLFFILLKNIGINPITIIKQLKGFLFLLALVFLSQWLSTAGENLFNLFGLQFSRNGLFVGSRVALAFLNVMLIGLIFTTTTRTMEIKSAVQWFLKPIPFVPETKVALMIGLSLKFIPLIIENNNEINSAINARCGNLVKNPVTRITNHIWPLLKKTFNSADNINLAMQSRCYSENRTDPEFYSNGKEWILLCLVIISVSCIALL